MAQQSAVAMYDHLMFAAVAVLKIGAGLREFDSYLVLFWLFGVGWLFVVVLLIHQPVGWLRDFLLLKMLPMQSTTMTTARATTTTT